MNLIANIIVLTEPILLYLFYSIKKENLNEEKNELLLDVSILSSLFLIIFFNQSKTLNEQCILITLPLLLAFLHNRSLLSIIMSIIIIDRCYSLNPSYIRLVIFEILILFILYYIYSTHSFKDKKFINYYCLISSLTIFILEYNNNQFNNILNIIINIIIYYILAHVIYSYMTKIKDILNTHMSIKEVEKDDRIQSSLFKITHEIKNPLAVIKGYLSIFNIDDKEKSNKYLNMIKNEIEHSLNILDDFKEFSKINIRKEDMNLYELIEDVKKTMIPLFDLKKVKYDFKYEKDINIKADYTRLKQVLINLLKNANEACLSKGLITLTSFKDEKYVYIIIKDNGIGMEKETLENLSTPFYTTKKDGTGLGVCLSKEIIEAHKGKINYTSVLYMGTTAKIVLPIN